MNNSLATALAKHCRRAVPIRFPYNLVFCLLLSLLHGTQSCQSGEDEEEEEDKEKTFEVSFHKD